LLQCGRHNIRQISENTKFAQLAGATDKLEGASAMALQNGKLYVLCTFANRVSQIDVGAK
jgi:hypothetical protein